MKYIDINSVLTSKVWATKTFAIFGCGCNKLALNSNHLPFIVLKISSLIRTDRREWLDELCY